MTTRSMQRMVAGTLRTRRPGALALPGLMTLAGLLALSGAASVPLEAQQPGNPTTRLLEAGAHLGPVITASGPVFTVENPDMAVPPDRVYKAVFEVTGAAASRDVLNSNLDNASRFLNMHVEAGVPLKNVQVALVIHGAATTDVLNNEAYRTRFGVDNPNLPLFRALADAGVRIYVCAQAARVFDVPRDQIAEPVDLALSAMTALVVLEGDGYQRVF